MASVRSSVPFQQEGFVPSPADALPRLPTPGWKVPDTLKCAQQLGCSIVLTGATELRIGHPLVGASQQVVHSAHRNDTSRALVGFLRQIREKIMQHRSPKHLAGSAGAVNGTIPPMHLSHKLHAQGVIERVEDEFGDLKKEAASFRDRALELEREVAEMRRQAEKSDAKPDAKPAKPAKPSEPAGPDPLDLPAADPRFVAAAESVSVGMGSIIEQIHYRTHCNDTEFRGFHECNNAICVRARAAMGEVRKLGLLATGLEQKNRQLKAAEQALFDELAAAEKRLGEMGGAAPAEAAAMIPGPASQMEDRAAVIFPDNVWIKDEDDAYARSEKFHLMARIFEDAMCRVEGSILKGSVLTRIMTAIGICVKSSGYDPKWEVPFRVLNFMRFRDELKRQRTPGNTNMLVGDKGWTQFVSTCEKLRGAGR